MRICEGACKLALTVRSEAPKKDAESVSLPANRGRERRTERHRGMLAASRGHLLFLRGFGR